MDILIKSFNRPYYLDRCLFSINKHIKNFDGKILILDDGTPQKYLDIIKEKYPIIEILTSEFYLQKSSQIENGEALTNCDIPVKLWKEAAFHASEQFLLLEDDFWFYKDFDIFFYEKEIIANNAILLKMIWIGNENVILGDYLNKNPFYSVYKPIFFTSNPYFFKKIFIENRFKFFSILNKLKIISKEDILKYYSIYSVAGAIFKKDYFLSLWDTANGNVYEENQLMNALCFLEKNESQFMRTSVEILKTGFLSSATNKTKIKRDINMFQFNRLVNDFWLEKNEIKSLYKLEADIELNEIVTILEKSKDIKIDPFEWKGWVEDFKNQFRKIGCKIE